MNKKYLTLFFTFVLIIPISVLIAKDIKAAPGDFESIEVTKFEQAAGDDLTDNVVTINMEITASTINFNQMDISLLVSGSSFLEPFNYDTEVGAMKTREDNDFVNGKLSLTFDVPLLFEGSNYISCFIFDYEQFEQYTHRIYSCGDLGIELNFTKVSPQIPVYRFFNTKLGTHLYTTSAIEKDGLKEEYYLNPNAEWEYEGYKFFVFKDAIAHPDSAPVYRFFNTKEGGHVYTISETEKNTISNTLPKYSYEGIKFYVVKNPTIGFVPVYRFFNTKTGTHLYTISENEKAVIMATLPEYTFEGTKFHVLEN